MGFKFRPDPSNHRSLVFSFVDPSDQSKDWKPLELVTQQNNGVHVPANFELGVGEPQSMLHRVREGTQVRGVSFVEGCGGLIDQKTILAGQKGRIENLGVEYEGT